ncbi:MAG: hypothetical protein WA843_03110 [Candidatus Saccharimonadales bacterium]
MPNSAPTQFPILDEGSVSFNQLDKDTQNRFLRNEFLIYSILAVVGLTLVTVLIGAAAIILDQLHFNNQVYRDGYVQPAQTKTIPIPKAGSPLVKPPDYP